MTRRQTSEKAMADTAVATGTLCKVQPIESVHGTEPFTIEPIMLRQGTAMTVEELMLAKVRWAQNAGYRVLSWNVPSSFAPYNAIIRVNESGTEDRLRDYLAEIAQ